MAQNSNILQELTELKSTLAELDSQNVYIVPEGYFEGLATQVLNRIKALEANTLAEELGHLSPLVSQLSRVMPYAVPAGYFEGLEARVRFKISEGSLSGEELSPKEELESISPLLSGIVKNMPYTVPQDYFENLSPVRSEKAAVETEFNQETRVIQITRRRRFNFAAAAMIAGILVLSGFLYFGVGANKNSFAKYEKKLDKEIQKTSDKELAEFVQQFTIAGLNGEEKVSIDTKQEPKDLLKDVPESELKQFLQETADPETEESAPLMN